jgi:TATA-binding protein-associated factor
MHDTQVVKESAAAVLALSATSSSVSFIAVPVFQLLLETRDASASYLHPLWTSLLPFFQVPDHVKLFCEIILNYQLRLPSSIKEITEATKILQPLLGKFFDTVTFPALQYTLFCGSISRRSFIAWLILYIQASSNSDTRLNELVLEKQKLSSESAIGFDDTVAGENALLEGLRQALVEASASPASTHPPPPTVASSQPPSLPSAPPTIDDMRLSSILSTCIFLKKAHQSTKKLTPLIRPIMTSVLNETDISYGDLNDMGVAQIVESVGGNVGKSVANKIVGLAETDNSNARRVLRLIVARRGNVCAEGGICRTICSVLAPPNVGSTDATFTATSQDDLVKALTLLEAIADVLADSDVLETTSAVPNITAVSTDHPGLRERSLASRSLCKLALHKRALEQMLPTLYDSVKDIMNDARRDNGALILLQIVNVLGVDVKDKVVELLPIAMGGMGDSFGKVGKRCANIFAKLIRVAPLVTDVESTDSVIKHLIHGKPLPPISLPPALLAASNNILLRNYQKEGVTWLNFLMDVNLNGVLSDEMGLGKTLQSLVAMAMRHVASPDSVSLVVCPSTLVNHWVGEVGKFFKKSVFNCIGYAGSPKERVKLRKDLAKGGVNLIVTSYAVLRNDTELLTADTTYLCTFLDEGHLLKNPNTATSQAARSIRSKHKFILSGTPVQNRVQELWAAFDFLMPNFLGSEREFQTEYGKVIGESLHEGEEKLLVGEAKVKLKQLHQQVLPFILRREKKDVLNELPDKIITDLVCELSDVQKRMYRSFCAKKDQIVGSSENNAFKALLYLRLLCVHPSLVVGCKQGEEEEDDSGALDFLGEDDAGSRCDKLEHSGKLLALKELISTSGIAGLEGTGVVGADNDTSSVFVAASLEEKEFAAEDKQTVEEGEAEEKAEEEEMQERADAANSSVARKDGKSNKCLIFAQHTKSLDVVERYLLNPCFPNMKYLRLDGKVAAGDRFGITQRFNEEEDVKLLLLTTKVGGLGLNLTGANIVIFLENDYNPVNDLQAMDRAHRIGQKESVNVYRLVVKGTVEEKIMKIQRSKIAMSDSIVTSDNSSMFAMGTERLLDLFVFDGGGGDDSECDAGGGADGVVDVLNDLWDDKEEVDAEYSGLNVDAFIDNMAK